MSALEELMQAALIAPAERRADALRVLQGQAQTVDHLVPGIQAEPYLTLREVAKRLGLSTCTLWRWGVPGHDLGGRRRFKLSDVQTYLESDAFKRRAAALRADRRKPAEPHP